MGGGGQATDNEDGGLGTGFVEKVASIDASLVVLSTPSLLSRNPALIIVRGGVLSYHPGAHPDEIFSTYQVYFLIITFTFQPNS